VANVVLLVVLVPSLGIAGAGVALCGAYAVMLTVMYLLTRRAFRVEFEWRRLAHLIIVMGGVAAAGELLFPTSGAVGFLARLAALVAIPGALWVTRFVHPSEARRIRALASRLRGPGAVREPA
jgi:O-antigen/teichoic acid export membrane protein